MIKRYLLPLAVLSSCTFIDYKQIPALTYRAIKGADDILVDQDFINKQEFSFVKVKIGKQSIAIMTLASIDKDTFRWVSATGEVIVTNNGRIVETAGLPYNINEVSRVAFQNNTFETFIFLHNPEAMVMKFSSFKSDPSNNLFFQEEFHVNKIKWKGTNNYKFNEQGLIAYSKQKIHPRMPDVEMFFYY